MRDERASSVPGSGRGATAGSAVSGVSDTPPRAPDTRTSGDLLERLRDCDRGTLRDLVNHFRIPGDYLVPPYHDGVYVWATREEGRVAAVHARLDEIGAP